MTDLAAQQNYRTLNGAPQEKLHSSTFVHKIKFMQEQNYKNHRQLVPHYHYVTSLLLLALLGGAISNVIQSTEDNIYSASLLLLAAVILLVLYFYTRGFALKAQDRAIRAEENLRHFAITGKVLPKDLGMGQIVALRFASDEEFPALVQKAVNENMSSKEIKLSVRNWRGDYYRV